MMRRETPTDEAAALLTRLASQLEATPGISVGIMVRRGTRLQELKNLAVRMGLDPEVWDEPLHERGTVQLLLQLSNLKRTKFYL